MGIFSFECNNCGSHEQCDYTDECIVGVIVNECKVGSTLRGRTAGTVTLKSRWMVKKNQPSFISSSLETVLIVGEGQSQKTRLWLDTMSTVMAYVKQKLP